MYLATTPHELRKPSFHDKVTEDGIIFSQHVGRQHLEFAVGRWMSASHYNSAGNSSSVGDAYPKMEHQMRGGYVSNFALDTRHVLVNIHSAVTVTCHG